MPSKYTHDKKKTGHGGLRIPSDTTLQKFLVQLSEESQNKVLLIQNTRPRRIKIFKEDLDQLKLIGAGNWATGFYRAMKLARRLWLTGAELQALEGIDPSVPPRDILNQLVKEKLDAIRKMDDQDSNCASSGETEPTG